MRLSILTAFFLVNQHLFFLFFFCETLSYVIPAGLTCRMTFLLQVEFPQFLFLFRIKFWKSQYNNFNFYGFYS